MEIGAGMTIFNFFRLFTISSTVRNINQALKEVNAFEWVSVLLLARNRGDKLKNIDKGQKDIRIPLDGGIILRQGLQFFGAFLNPFDLISYLLIHFISFSYNTG